MAEKLVGSQNNQKIAIKFILDKIPAEEISEYGNKQMKW